MSETALGGSGDGGNSGQSGGAAGGSGGSSGVHSGAGGSNSGGSASWRDALPADIKEHATLTKYSDLANFAKAHIHAQELIGRKGAIVPGEKDSDQAWSEFFKSIGVPEADKYEIKVSDGVKVPEASMKWLKEIAHKNGLLPKQAASMLEGFMQFEKQTIDGMSAEKTKQQTAALDGLKKEWGDAYQKELNTAHFAVKEIGGQEFIQYLNKSGLGDDVNLIRIFAKVGKLLGEDKLREGGIGGDARTAQEVDAQIAELRAKGHENGLYDPNHAMHKATVSKMESLYKQKTGGR